MEMMRMKLRKDSDIANDVDDVGDFW